MIKNWADPDACKPTTGAIGLGPDKLFVTAHLKEYPERLGHGLAQVVCDSLRDLLRARFNPSPVLPISDEALAWVERMYSASKEVHREAFLPDYQGL